VSEPASRLSCAGCGWTPPIDDPYPFRCANAGSGDGADHVIARALDPSRVSWPPGDEPNPFVRYRELQHSYHVARARGMSDAEFVELVERLDKEVAAVAGTGFVQTPFARADGLSTALGFEPPGGVWVKDETANVSGSHKARHLFGVLLHLAVAEETGLTDASAPRPELAIASCGNAALAAAVVARAADRPLRVFVPTWADPAVVDRLRSLGAQIEVCERSSGVPGDPTYHALQAAVAGGAIPFTCQGNENGLAIEGGETLAYEMVSSLREAGAALDRVFVQVGGGALASAVIAGFAEARDMGVIGDLPRFHAVQTAGGYPLKRAYDLVAERILVRIEREIGVRPDAADDEAERAAFMAQHASSGFVANELEHAARHRSQFMWPWEEEPRSLATGILDDETYDWLAVVRGMITTGGYPVVVDEEILERANELGRVATRIDADHTGTAGLAGLMELRDRGEVGTDERVAVLLTGVRRETMEEGT
jgi:threonine synthase